MDINKKDEKYHKCLFAYDYETGHFVLMKDYTNNLSEDKCGMTWSEVYDELEFKECLEFSDMKETGFYVIEFIAWGYGEPDTEAGYGWGDGDIKIINIQRDNNIYKNN